MKTLIGSICLIFFALTASAQTTQVFEEWTTEQGTQNFFLKTIVRTGDDGGGNDVTYVGGATLNGNGDYDILVSKV